MPNKTISDANMQQLASFVILLAMSPVLLVLVVVSIDLPDQRSFCRKWNPWIDSSAKLWKRVNQQPAPNSSSHPPSGPCALHSKGDFHGWQDHQPLQGS